MMIAYIAPRPLDVHRVGNISAATQRARTVVIRQHIQKVKKVRLMMHVFLKLRQDVIVVICP